jgi:large subunit ribosomal protein L18
VSIVKKQKERTKRRGLRVRGAQKSRGLKPRVSVFRSLKQIYAQIIDDSTHSTKVSFSSISLKGANGDKTAIAKLVGIELGKLAVEKGIVEVFFDRGSNKYHGRVRALAEGLREGGLKF